MSQRKQTLLRTIETLLAQHSSSDFVRGLNYQEQGRVDIETLVEDSFYDAFVSEQYEYEVSIHFKKPAQCEISCACSAHTPLCKHTAAALLELKSLLGAEALQKTTKKTAPSRADSTLLSLLPQFKIPNKRSAEKFIERILSIYQNLDLTETTVPGQKINALLGQHAAPPWTTIKLWHEAPSNDHEFWLYLVRYANSQHLDIPKTMQPFSDLVGIAAPLKRWEQHKEVQEWTGFFYDSTDRIEIAEALRTATHHELRVAFSPSRAQIQFLDNNTGSWKTIPKHILKDLNEAVEIGRPLALTPLSEILFQFLVNAENTRVKASYRLNDYPIESLISAALRSSTLQKQLIAPGGAPFEIGTSELQWNATPVDTDPPGYKVHITDREGQPLEGVQHIFQRNSCTFMTNDALLPIPRVQGAQIELLFKTDFIPAAAAESEAGLRYLHTLCDELPPQLSERIEAIVMEPGLHCQIDRAYQEECMITPLGLSPGGTTPLEIWSGEGWVSINQSHLASKLGFPPTIQTEPAKEEARTIVSDRRLLRSLETHPTRLSGRASQYDGAHYVRVTKKFPEQFVEWLESLPESIHVILDGELAAFKDRGIAGKMRLQAEENEQDWFDLSVVLDVEDTSLSKEEIDLLLAANGKWVRLPDKGWRRLALDLDDDTEQDFAALGLNPRDLNDEPQRLHALQLANPATRKLLPEEEAESVERRAQDLRTRVTPPLPKTLTADLRPYQIEGYHFLAYLSTNRFGGILADDMGLGKTLQTLTWLLWLRAQSGRKKPLPCLVVCPKSVMDNWVTDSAKFTKKLKVKTWSGTPLKDLPKSVKKADLHVINYHQLRKIGPELASIKFLAVILDEGQFIKNPTSDTAVTARKLQAVNRLVLTGTPIENRALDLWSLMAFAMPGVLGNRSRFVKAYDKKDDPLGPIRLAARVRPFLLRRTKAQVAQDLPERIEDEIHCEIEGTQRKLYAAELKRAQQTLLKTRTQEELNELRFNFLTSLLRLRQICCHPKLYDPKYRGQSAKITALLELLEPMLAEGAKVLVFSQFVELLNLLQSALAEKDIHTWHLTGKTENRGDLVKSFQESPDPGVFLISLKAGGSGLNLTAASYVILFDPWWNPAVEAQAIDRTHRIGQTQRIIAYRLVVKNSIEEKIRNLQEKKKALVENVLGEEKFSQSLSLDDFRYLLSSDDADART